MPNSDAVSKDSALTAQDAVTAKQLEFCLPGPFAPSVSCLLDSFLHPGLTCGQVWAVASMPHVPQMPHDNRPSAFALPHQTTSWT